MFAPRYDIKYSYLIKMIFAQLYLQVTILNANNLFAVKWFQVFLSNTNNLQLYGFKYPCCYGPVKGPEESYELRFTWNKVY